jgi:hypothetical protein
MNNTNIDLEPRLVEYLKRKKFYEENDINTVSLEKQYQITKSDLQRINDFYNGERNYVQRKVVNYDENTDLIDCSKSRFPTNNIYDNRLDRINEKIKREKDANKERIKTDNLKNSYDMYSRNFSSATSMDFNNEFSLDNIRDEMNAELKCNYEANSKFNTHELINQPSKHQYNNPPKIEYNQIQHFQRVGMDDKKCNIGSGYTYRKPETPQFEKTNTFDIDNKINIPSNNCRKNDLNTLYNEFNNVGNMKNIDFENYVRYGYPTSKARSLGFENPAEHQYQFIDSDIQDPSHVIFDRPISSRLDNKTTARNKTRDIY